MHTIQDRAYFRVFGPDDPPAPGTGTPPTEGENSVIRHMREQLASQSEALKAANDAKAAAEQKALELEREKMSEAERTRAELADAKAKLTEAEKAQLQIGKYETTFETLYTKELESAPADKQEVLKQLSAKGAWNDRLEDLRRAKELLPPAERVPIVGGSITNPAGGGATGGTPPSGGTPPNQNPPAAFDPSKIPSWDEALKAPPKS